MNTKSPNRWLALALFFCATTQLFAQGTAFTYQGRLYFNGNPAAGSFDLRFAVFDTNSLGNQVSATVTNAATPVTNGLFEVSLDFGPGVFTGPALWLEIAARTNGPDAFTTLAPRQALTATPYAVFAGGASNLLGTVPAEQLSGTILPTQLPTNVVTNTEAGVTLGGTFGGNGGGLNNLNASALTGGTVPTNVLVGFQAPYYAVIGGGQFNTANNTYAVVGGGAYNNASYLASVGGGQNNNASGYFSVIPGGQFNVASGQNSFAAGQQAQALHQGAFVWADSQPAPFASLTNDTFNVRAAGGVNFVTGPGGVTVNGQPILTNLTSAPGAVSSLGAPDGSPATALQVNNNGNVGIGTSTPVAGLQIASSASIPTLSVLYEVGNGRSGWSNLNYVECSAIQGNLVAFGGYEGITIADMSNPSYPLPLSTIIADSPGYDYLRNVFGLVWSGSNLVAGDYGFPGSKPSTVFIFSCANPANPVRLAALTNGLAGWNYLDQIYGVAVSGNVLAIGSRGSNAVTLADISNPSAPALKSVMINGVNGFNQLYQVDSVAMSHNLLAIGSSGSNAVTLVDVSNPASPVKRAELVQGAGGYTNLSGIQSVALSESGTLLVIAAEALTGGVTSGAVTLVDVSNPASPVKLAELIDGAGGYALNGANSVAISGNRLVIGDGNASIGPFHLTLVDISNPASPVLLATATDGLNGADYLWQPAGLSISGTNVVAGGYGNGLSAQHGITFLGIGSGPAGLVSAGWVGIGTTQPTAALDVVGNVVVHNATLFDVNANEVAIGNNASAIGYGSTAIGYGASAIGSSSVALGFNTVASGNYSTAMGSYTTAAGADATVMGLFSTAGGAASTAMGEEASAAHDNTFVWADGTTYPESFSSTISNEFSICAENGVHIQSDKGIHLNGANNPIIVRDLDLFAANAPAAKAGMGRWGLFMETNSLTAGIPADDVSGKTFQVAKYSTNGLPTTLMRVDQSGNLTAGGSLTVNANIRAAGVLRSGAETGTSEAPSPAGMVVRRVNSTSASAGQIVARTDKFTLERDGSGGGFLIRYPASPGNVTLSCMGMNSSGAAVNFYTALNNPSTAGTVQIYSNAQNIVHFECSFGVTYTAGQHLTQVTLSRFGTDFYWSGTLMSTFNQ